MSIRGGFDRLTKEIDALTYNARSVLNALIRSTVASGTSQGYTVTRAGVELTLSRVDVYRLYTFYQAWAANGFATEPGQTNSAGRTLLSFDEIRVEQDKTCVTLEDGTQNCNATTDALVKHSQILFLNSTTLGESDSTVVDGQIVDNTNATNYWLGLLKDFNDPKLLTNSSPIPINLRTPVFDENMATTAYNNHPTYLFPYQYFGLQLLGYPGDDTDHFGGGNSWTWELDQFLSFKTPAFASGGVNSASVYKTDDQRNYILNPQTGRPFEPTWSTVWGYDTHARSLYSTAGGRSSMVPRGATNSTAIGLRNLASYIQGASIGGTSNISAGQNTGVYAGQFNRAVGPNSFVTGVANITGGRTFNFTLPQSDASDECVVDTDNCTAQFQSTGSQFGANEVAIDGNVAGIIKANDFVSMYAYTTFVADTNESQNQYFQTNGDTFVTVNTRVISVAYIDDETSLNFNKTIVVLNDDIPNPARIDGGIITITQSTFGQSSTPIRLGNGSAAFGEGNLASGERQLVIGQFNRNAPVDTTPVGDGTFNFNLSRFVVGSGSSTTNRRNTFEVYDGRVIAYGTTNSRIEDIPVTTQDYNANTFRGFNVQNNRINMIFDSHRIELNENGFRLDKLLGTGARVSVRTTGANFSEDNLSGPDNLLIENWQKAIKIQTGANTSFPTGSTSFITDLDIALISANDVHISALDDVIIESSDVVEIKSGDNLNISWDSNLVLTGNTLGTLPTTADSSAHELNEGSFNFNDIDSAGFFWVNNALGGPLVNFPPGAGNDGDDSYFVLNNARSGGDQKVQIATKNPISVPASPTVPEVGRVSVRKIFGTQVGDWYDIPYLEDVGAWENITDRISKVSTRLENGDEFVDITSSVKNNGNTFVRMRKNYDTVFLDMSLGFSDTPDSAFDGTAYSIEVDFFDNTVPFFISGPQFKFWDVNNAPAITEGWGNAGAILRSNTNEIVIRLFDNNTGEISEIDRPGSGTGPKLHNVIAFRIYSNIVNE